MSYSKDTKVPFRYHRTTCQTGNQSSLAEAISAPCTTTVDGFVTIGDIGVAGSYGEQRNWRSKIKAQVQAGTEMSISVNSWIPGNISMKGFSPASGGRWSRTEITRSNFGPSNFVSGSLSNAPSAPSESSANSKALSVFVQQARKRQTQVQGGVIAGELVKTAKLLRHPLRSFYYGLRRYLRDVKKRLRNRRTNRRRDNDSLNRIAADTWLEYAFGWTPLINDIDDASRYLAYKLTLPEHHEPHFAVGVGKEENELHDGKYTITCSGARLTYTKMCVRRVTVVYKGLLRDVTTYGSYKHRDLGLGLENFLPTVWELIPYSFLVDYFTNVGSIVEAISFRRSNFRWIMKWSITEDERMLAAPVGWFVNSQSASYGYAFGDPCSRLDKTIYRAPYVGSLIPDFQFEVPGLSMKWLNMAALAATKFV